MSGSSDWLAAAFAISVSSGARYDCVPLVVLVCFAKIKLYYLQGTSATEITKECISVQLDYDVILVRTWNCLVKGRWRNVLL